MRYFVDTNVFIYSLDETFRLKKNVLQIFEDYDNQIYVSSDTEFPLYRKHGLDLIEN